MKHNIDNMQPSTICQHDEDSEMLRTRHCKFTIVCTFLVTLPFCHLDKYTDID